MYSVERIEALYQQARKRLAELEFFNLQLRHTDGTGGWPNLSYQFDRIIMTAACTEIPEALVAQLKPGGVMVLPFDDGRDLDPAIKASAQMTETEAYRGLLGSLVSLNDRLQQVTTAQDSLRLNLAEQQLEIRHTRLNQKLDFEMKVQKVWERDDSAWRVGGDSFE